MSSEPPNSTPTRHDSGSNDDVHYPDPAYDRDSMIKDRPNKRPPKEKEIGGPAGPEPTRYGDWERNGRCIDF